MRLALETGGGSVRAGLRSVACPGRVWFESSTCTIPLSVYVCACVAVAPASVPPCGVTGPFTCPLCGNVYRHVDSFRCHLHVHAGKTQCHLCQRVFSRRTRLNAHLSAEHGLESAYSPRGVKEPWPGGGGGGGGGGL